MCLWNCGLSVYEVLDCASEGRACRCPWTAAPEAEAGSELRACCEEGASRQLLDPMLKPLVREHLALEDTMLCDLGGGLEVRVLVVTTATRDG